MLRAGRFITPPQLFKYLFPCRLIHVLIHSGHGNRTSGTTNHFSPPWPPARVTKLLAQFALKKTPQIHQKKLVSTQNQVKITHKLCCRPCHGPAQRGWGFPAVSRHPPAGLSGRMPPNRLSSSAHVGVSCDRQTPVPTMGSFHFRQRCADKSPCDCLPTGGQGGE